MQPSVGAKRMVGASGASLTVIGELRRCPVLLNGYEYHVNLVIADLGIVDATLGMDFLMAYGVTINLKNDTVSLEAGALINPITECTDRIPVRLHTDWALLTFKSMSSTSRWCGAHRDISL